MRISIVIIIYQILIMMKSLQNPNQIILRKKYHLFLKYKNNVKVQLDIKILKKEEGKKMVFVIEKHLMIKIPKGILEIK